MGIPTSEQETVIQFSRSDNIANVWTSDTTVMTKIKKFIDDGDWEVIESGKVDGEVVSMRYRAPKKLISLRKAIVTRELTDEQRIEIAERMKKVRSGGNND